MKVKITTLVLAIVFATTAVALAQGNHVRATKAERRGEGVRMAQKLGLSQEQVQQIRDIVKQYRADAVRVLKSEATREQKADQIKSLKANATAAINAVLTPEQQEKAKGLIDKILSPRRHREAKALWVLKQLNLTEDQKTQVKAILQESRTQAKAVYDDSTLTNEQKRERVAEIRKTTFDKIKALLTPEQLQKLEELKKNRPQPRERGAR
jgi:Spy/CpxP family protein refolding chaperone